MALLGALPQIDGLMPEQHLDLIKPGQAVEQNPLEIRLVEGAESGVTVEPASQHVSGHQDLPARVEVTDTWILQKPGRDLIQQPDLGEKPQGLDVVGDARGRPSRPSLRSRTVTLTPARPSRFATMSPTGPAPTTATSVSASAVAPSAISTVISAFPSLCPDLPPALLTFIVKTTKKSI